ncbi:MAG: hypothetical protein ACR2PI_03750, partial [Hyphomicrobiaceae bacterium]
VDYARYTNARNQTTAAIDAAVIAGARTLLLGAAPSAAVTAAQEYYSKNVTDRYPVISDTVTFSVADNNTSITGSGNAHLPTTLLKLAGINDLPLVNASGSQFPKAKIMGGGGGDIEVAVMLDVTGSMCDGGAAPCTSGTKMDALKNGAKDLVNIVVQTDQSTYKSRVALVPFAHRIRVAPNGQGGSLMQSLTDLNPTWSGWIRTCTSSSYVGPGSGGTVEAPTGDVYSCDSYANEQVSNWKIRPCITERAFDAGSTIDTTDDAPTNNAWMNGYEGRRRPISNDSGSNPPSSGLGNSSSDPSSHYNYSSSGYCSTPQENQIVPLSDDKADLMSKIDGLKATGSTAGALGTAVTWYMLSPKWNGVWPSASSADPYSHLSIEQPNGQKKLRKVAVLMSDGVFNAMRSWTNQNQQDVSDHAKAICSAMKAEGIEIYTIGFDLDSLPSGERAIAIDTLQSCGTDIEHFYNTLDPDQLQSAFRDIAVKMSQISLMQ